MRRDPSVLLMTVVESADAIADAVKGISFRNKLTHDYDRVDDSLVWGVIHKSLPPLRAICSDLIDNLTQEES